MAKVEADLRKTMRESPSATFDLIVKVEGDLQDRIAELNAAGVSVKRQFRLTNTVEIRCSGAQALKLARESWWVKAESDRPVRVMGR